MKKLLLAPFLVLFLTGSLLAEPVWCQPSDWTLGTEFPSQPEELADQKTAAPGGEIVESRVGVLQNDDIFLVVRVRLSAPILPEQVDAAYSGDLESMQRGNSRTILSAEKILIAGHVGRRWLLQSVDGLRVTDHRIVILGDETFEFIYDRPTNQSFGKAAETFFSKIASRKSPARTRANAPRTTLAEIGFVRFIQIPPQDCYVRSHRALRPHPCPSMRQH